MPIPKWKWERITMDFVTGLSKTLGKFDSIWLIVDRLTKSAQFVPDEVSYTAEKLAKMYIRDIVRLHGIPISVVSDRGTIFMSRPNPVSRDWCPTWTPVYILFSYMFISHQTQYGSYNDQTMVSELSHKYSYKCKPTRLPSYNNIICKTTRPPSYTNIIPQHIV